MRIIQLTAENVKKLTVVSITPDGNLVQITGLNGQGKTSVLDAIWFALDAAAAGKGQTKPIRKGAKTARIELKLGDGKAVKLIVERRFTETDSYLTVRTEDGAEYKRPQALLDDLFGALTFDPLGFLREKPRGQYDVLRQLVKLDVDLDALEAANTADYAARTTINRDVKAKRAQAQGIQVADDLPAEPIDEAAILDEMQDAADFNADVVRLTTAKRDIAREIARHREEAQSLRAKAAQLLADAARIEELAVRVQTTSENAPPVPDVKDIGIVRAKLDRAKAVNTQIAQRRRREALEHEAEQLETKAEQLTTSIERRGQRKLESIARATMPIPGLNFGDGEVLYDGLPLTQASDAQQLMISTAIAAALNPKLRVIRIRDGSLLDDNAMAQLAKFADERDMQIWIERVDGSGAVGIVMEDGHVKGQEQQAAE
jgi:DNA repair exonuclease SbcCD ATPase subunit